MRMGKRKRTKTTEEGRLDPELRSLVEARAQEILEEDPSERSARTMRMLAERIAYHEIMAERESASG
jgi:hypothetical protein